MPYMPTFPVPGPGDSQRVALRLAEAKSEIMDAILRIDDTLMYDLPDDVYETLQRIRHNLGDQHATLRSLYRWEVPSTVDDDGEPWAGAINA